MRDGISLRGAVIGGIAILVGLTVATAMYFRSMQAALYADARAAVTEVPPDDAALAATAAALDAARARHGEIALDDLAANRAIFNEWLSDAGRDARLSLDPPTCRLALAQQLPDGRWLNAQMFVAPFARAEGGLGFRVLSGTVGSVSISRTGGEWARRRIEIQLETDLARNPRTAELFRGVTDVRVTQAGLVLRF
jgi:hypothetical protein